MKHLETYKTFEASLYPEREDLKQTLKDICIDLEDEGFTPVVGEYAANPMPYLSAYIPDKTSISIYKYVESAAPNNGGIAPADPFDEDEDDYGDDDWHVNINMDADALAAANANNQNTTSTMVYYDAKGIAAHVERIISFMKMEGWKHEIASGDETFTLEEFESVPVLNTTCLTINFMKSNRRKVRRRR